MRGLLDSLFASDSLWLSHCQGEGEVVVVVLLSFPPEELEIIKGDGPKERGEISFTEDSKWWMPGALILQMLKQLHEGSHLGSL